MRANIRCSFFTENHGGDNFIDQNYKANTIVGVLEGIWVDTIHAKS